MGQALERLELKLTRVSVPAHVRVRSGKLQRVDPYTYERDSSWREQAIRVEGRVYRLGDVTDGRVEVRGRLFHGSTASLKPGDTLKPGSERNFKESAAGAVSITSDPGRAAAWARESRPGQPVYVYEIEPLDVVKPWRVGPSNYGENFVLWEGRVKAARVVGLLPE
jgi:hypothetical protein